ncbi:MAG: 3-hydroxy-3-methylglutaryl-CoA reductase [Deltaproteobacteria bacterium]|nr:3-hydroxy-3-methylglutaryl-CoA reductase [Deltaproteobacteria bacterium]
MKPSRSTSRQLPHWPRANRPEQLTERQDHLRALPHWHAAHHHVLSWPVTAEVLANFQECLAGHMVLPVGVVGPITLNLGQYSLTGDGMVQEDARQDDRVFVPLVHTEGGLSASIQRGISAVALAGGVKTYVLADRMTRDSCFVFRSTEEALSLARWIETQTVAMAKWLTISAREKRHTPQESRTTGETEKKALAPTAVMSTHAVLREVQTHVIGPMCHVLYRFTTGDACGPNMMTRNAYALNQQFVLERFSRETGITPLHVFLETNMGGDKKPSHAFFQFPGHGKVVVAEATLPGAVLRRVLRVSADSVVALEHAGLHGAHASGMQSFAFTPASAVAAIFAATGQDLGMVGTSSMTQATATRVDDGIHLTIRFSGLEVGTLGGGTSLPHAQAYLQLMDCLGTGKVYRFAQIIAATALCLELSAAASMATTGSENFLQAHFERGGVR